MRNLIMYKNIIYRTRNLLFKYCFIYAFHLLHLKRLYFKFIRLNINWIRHMMLLDWIIIKNRHTIFTYTKRDSSLLPILLSKWYLRRLNHCFPSNVIFHGCFHTIMHPWMFHEFIHINSFLLVLEYERD